MADDLYEQDFYLWTQAQAEALRGHGRGANMLDYENLAEEVESLGRSERREASSRIFRILEHLFKLTSTRNGQVTGHWRGEIILWRNDLEHLLTRTIRTGIEQELEALHEKGAKAAQKSMEHYEPGVAVDAARRWSLGEILGEINDPLAAYEEALRTADSLAHDRT